MLPGVRGKSGATGATGAAGATGATGPGSGPALAVPTAANYTVNAYGTQAAAAWGVSLVGSTANRIAQSTRTVKVDGSCDWIGEVEATTLPGVAPGGCAIALNGSTDLYTWGPHGSQFYRGKDVGGTITATSIGYVYSNVRPFRFYRITVAAGVGARAVLVYVSTDAISWILIDTQPALDVARVGIGCDATAIGNSMATLFGELWA